MNTLQSKWDQVSEIIIPQGTSLIQARETKRAFYLGAYSMLNVQADIAGMKVTEETMVKMLDNIQVEIEQFISDIKRGKA